jgi:hypothetical protein
MREDRGDAMSAEQEINQAMTVLNARVVNRGVIMMVIQEGHALHVLLEHIL